jgi:hypothetical protein
VEFTWTVPPTFSLPVAFSWGERGEMKNPAFQRGVHNSHSTKVLMRQSIAVGDEPLPLTYDFTGRSVQLLYLSLERLNVGQNVI